MGWNEHALSVAPISVVPAIALWHGQELFFTACPGGKARYNRIHVAPMHWPRLPGSLQCDMAVGTERGHRTANGSCHDGCSAWHNCADLPCRPHVPLRHDKISTPLAMGLLQHGFQALHCHALHFLFAISSTSRLHVGFSKVHRDTSVIFPQWKEEPPGVFRGDGDTAG